jgi:hypothetical protein
MLGWWIAILLWNVVAVTALLAVRRRPGAKQLLGRLALAFALLLLGSGPAGLVIALVTTRSSAGAPVDPADKARVLGQTIAEVMNCAAFAVVSFTLPAIVALVCFLRARRVDPGAG